MKKTTRVYDTFGNPTDIELNPKDRPTIESLKHGVKVFADLIDEKGIESLAVKQAYATACKSGHHRYMTSHLEGIASGSYSTAGDIAMELIQKYNR